MTQRFDADGNELVAVTRYDRGEVRKWHRDDDTGYLHLDVVSITKAPAVFIYQDAKGKIRREFRRPEHVFSADNMKRMANATFTNEHPQQKVTTKNARKFGVGHGDGKVRVDNDHAIVGAVVQDDDTIDDVLNDRKRDTSCGYDCDLVMKPGVWTDGKGVEHHYDAEQINHRNNHVAFVPRGRAETTRVHLDSGEAVQIHDEQGARQMSDKTDDKPVTREDFFNLFGDGDKAGVTIDGVQLKLPVDQAKLVADAMVKRENDLRDAKTKLEASEAGKVTLEAKADKAEKDLKEAKEKLDELEKPENVKARTDDRILLLANAKGMGKFDDKKWKEVIVMDDASIRKEVVKANNPKLDEKKLESEVYVDAAYDLLAQDHNPGKKTALDTLSAFVAQPPKRKDDTVYDEDELHGDDDDETRRQKLEDRANKAMRRIDTQHTRSIKGSFTYDAVDGRPGFVKRETFADEEAA